MKKFIHLIFCILLAGCIFTGDYIYSEFSGNGSQVVSHFELFGPDWNADDIAHKSFGNYKIIFDVVNENSETFLRFNRFEKE